MDTVPPEFNLGTKIVTDTKSLHPFAFVTSRVTIFSSVIFDKVKVGVGEFEIRFEPPDEKVYV